MTEVDGIEMVKLTNVYDASFWDILKRFDIATLAPLQKRIMLEKAFIDLDEDFEPEDVPALTMRVNVLHMNANKEPTLTVMVVRRTPEANVCYIPKEDLEELE